MIRLLALTTMLCLLSTPALGGKVYKWVDENGKIHFTDDINKIPSKARSKVKDLFNKTSGKTASDDAASRDPSNAKPATKAEKTDFLKRIKAVYKIKNARKREGAFNNLFYLKGVDPEFWGQTKGMILGFLASFKNPTISFQPLPGDFKRVAQTLPALGRVAIKGKMGKGEGSGGAPYGRKGDTLFFVALKKR